MTPRCIPHVYDCRALAFAYLAQDFCGIRAGLLIHVVGSRLLEIEHDKLHLTRNHGKPLWQNLGEEASLDAPCLGPQAVLKGVFPARGKAGNRLGLGRGEHGGEVDLPMVIAAQLI